MGTQDLQYSRAHCGVAHDARLADGLSHWRIGQLMDFSQGTHICHLGRGYVSSREGVLVRFFFTT